MKRFAIAFAALFLVVGIACLASAVVPSALDYRDRSLIEASGVRAAGMVLAKRRAGAGQVSVLNATAPLYDYFVRYRFPIEGGRTAEGTARVSAQAWRTFEERGPIDVRYVAGDPAASRIAGQLAPGGLSAVVFAIVGALFAAIGGFMLYVVLRDR